MATTLHQRFPHRDAAAARSAQAPGPTRRRRRVRCLSGPSHGARWVLDAGATEHVVAVPDGQDGGPREAVYHIQRRRRGRGPAYEVLVFVGYRAAGAERPPAAR
jgi:hypothetical protein